MSHQLGLSAVPTILYMYITIKPYMYVLCSALPPSALLYQAKASCYCGKIKMSIKTDEPVFAAFCHCVSCRKVHSAPLYQVVYVKPDEITIEGASS